jgi:deoxycytidylate deaminase
VLTVLPTLTNVVILFHQSKILAETNKSNADTTYIVQLEPTVKVKKELVMTMVKLVVFNQLVETKELDVPVFKQN